MQYCFVFVDRQPRPARPAPILVLLPSHPTLFFSSDCRLTYTTTVSQPFAHQALPYTFHRDGGGTLYPERSRRAAAPKPLLPISFADPHPLTHLESYRFKNMAGGGNPRSLSFLSLLSATLMDHLASVANTGLT